MLRGERALHRSAVFARVLEGTGWCMCQDCCYPQIDVRGALGSRWFEEVWDGRRDKSQSKLLERVKKSRSSSVNCCGVPAG